MVGPVLWSAWAGTPEYEARRDEVLAWLHKEGVTGAALDALVGVEVVVLDSVPCLRLHPLVIDERGLSVIDPANGERSLRAQPVLRPMRQPPPGLDLAAAVPNAG